MLCLAAGSACGDELQFGDAWDWPLPPRRFGHLSQVERVAYTKAEQLFRENNFAAAAIEFEKFGAQHPDSPVQSHALLLRAYSLHMARQRNTAIELYTELLDFFSTKTDDAVPAMYLMAMARIQNGNIETGLRGLEELVANEKYLAHPLADVALNRLGDHYVTIEKEKDAEKCWQLVVSAFANAFIRPEDAVAVARSRLTELYIKQARYSALETLLATGDSKPKALVEAVVTVYELGMTGFGNLDEKGREAFARWFRGKSSWFTKAGEEDDFLDRSLRLAYRANATKDWNELAAKAIALCGTAEGKRKQAVCFLTADRLAEATRGAWKMDSRWKEFSDVVLETSGGLSDGGQLSLFGGIMDRMRFNMKLASTPETFWNALLGRCLDIYKNMFGDDKDRGLASLVDRLRGAGYLDRAHGLADQIEYRPLGMWKKAELFGHQEKHKEMAETCEAVEQMDDRALSMRALTTRADLYRDKLTRYQDAILLYNEINDPPRTVWAVIDCYERWSKPQEAVNSCTEIENFFEKDAPRAGFRKAEIWRRAGDSKKAIAACRAVLKRYPRHQVSSQAHQMLEQYGIRTGGGVMEVDE